jgi:hypothetical protein
MYSDQVAGSCLISPRLQLPHNRPLSQCRLRSLRAEIHDQLLTIPIHTLIGQATAKGLRFSAPEYRIAAAHNDTVDQIRQFISF